MKKYKIFNDHIELYFDLYSDLALNKVVELLNIMELNFSNLIFNCLYDQDIIDVNLIDDNIIVTVLQKKKKFIRLIKCKEIEIEVNTIETLKKLFEISNYFDATLTFKSTNGINNSTKFIVNDNGHHYIFFDRNKQKYMDIQIKLKNIFK